MLLVFLLAVCTFRTGTAQQPDAPAVITEKQSPLASAYAGDSTCRPCHTQSNTYFQTAHHFTSQSPTAQNLGGSFSPGSNVLQTSNPRLTFQMDTTDVGFTETAKYIDKSSQLQTLTQPIDIVVGSGRKGHTYLYWNGDQLFELPVSYWTSVNAWVNSPGFTDGTAHFDRPIAPQCLGCHGGYFESADPPVNRYLKSSLVLGITCERCHGPAHQHVELEQRAHTADQRRLARAAIVSIGRLSRDQQIDVCAQCHAGPGMPLAPVLSFLPGKSIADYVKIKEPQPDAPLDVHTNQVQLLRMSRCFQSSSLTCSACHNVHVQQRDTTSFSARCLTCHQVKACGKFAQMGQTIRTRCVDCHMPAQNSDVLFSNSEGERLTPLIRNHRIAIYVEREDVPVPQLH